MGISKTNYVMKTYSNSENGEDICMPTFLLRNHPGCLDLFRDKQIKSIQEESLMLQSHLVVLKSKSELHKFLFENRNHIKTGDYRQK